MPKEHEGLEVRIHGPSEKYRSIMLSLESRGPYHLSSGYTRACLTIHQMTNANLALIRNTIDTYLAEHSDEVKAEEEERAAEEAAKAAEAALKKEGESGN